MMLRGWWHVLVEKSHGLRVETPSESSVSAMMLPSLLLAIETGSYWGYWGVLYDPGSSDPASLCEMSCSDRRADLQFRCTDRPLWDENQDVMFCFRMLSTAAA